MVVVAPQLLPPLRQMAPHFIKIKKVDEHENAIESLKQQKQAADERLKHLYA